MSEHGLNARIQAYGYLGVPSPGELFFDLTGTKLYNNLARRQLVQNLTPLLSSRGTFGEAESSDRSPLVLAWKNVFPSSQNTTSVWGGASTYLYTKPGAFGGGTVNALAHELDAANVSSQYRSTFYVEENQPWAMRVLAFKSSDTNQKYGVLHIRFEKWQLQIADGKVDLMHFSPQWSQTEEDAILVLLQQDGMDSDVGVKRAAIYDVYESLEGATETRQGDFFEITVIPESMGALTVYVGDHASRISVPWITEARSAGVVYPRSRLLVRANGIMFDWQTGYPYFAPTGSLVYPWKSPFDTADLGDLTVNEISDTSGTGTSMGVDVAAIDPVNATITLSGATDDRRYTPFIYSAQAFLAGGERIHNGGQDIVWDSNDHLIGGACCIEEISIDMDSNWRRRLDATIYDIDGTTFPAGDLHGDYEACENRLVDAALEVDGVMVPVCTKGLVTEIERQDMAIAEEGHVIQAGGVARPESKVRMLIEDAWSYLDEDKLKYDIILDGRTVGDAVKFLLRGGGEPASVLVNISDTFGRLLPTAMATEEPCVVIERGTSRAQALRDLVDRWGFGAQLFQGFDGLWNLIVPSTSVVVNFEHDIAYGPRLIRGKLDFTRDYHDVYNSFLVEGWEYRPGERHVASWNIVEGYKINSASGAIDKRHIGRFKPYDPVQEDGARTADDVEWVLRSLVENYGGSGRMIAWEAGFFPDLFPGMRVRAGGTLLKLKRISNSSIADDTMSYVGQEIQEVAAPEEVID